MDDKNKDKLDEEKRREEDINTEEELFEMLEQIISSDKNSTKYNIKKAAMPVQLMRTFNNIWVDFLYSALLSLILVISVCGLFNTIITNHFYELIIIGISFGIIDYWAKTLVFILSPLTFLKSGGLIFALVSTIVMAGVCILAYFIFNVSFNDAWTVVLSHLSLLLIRFIISTYIKRKKL